MVKGNELSLLKKVHVSGFGPLEMEMEMEFENELGV